MRRHTASTIGPCRRTSVANAASSPRRKRWSNSRSAVGSGSSCRRISAGLVPVIGVSWCGVLPGRGAARRANYIRRWCRDILAPASPTFPRASSSGKITGNDHHYSIAGSRDPFDEYSSRSLGWVPRPGRESIRARSRTLDLRHDPCGSPTTGQSARAPRPTRVRQDAPHLDVASTPR